MAPITLDAPSENPLLWEALAFASVMNNLESEESQEALNAWWTLEKDVHEVLEQIRHA